MKTYSMLILFVLICFSPFTYSQISITGTGTYLQDFNTLAITGTSNVLPSGWRILESGTAANDEYTAGTGTSTTGETYSFGSTDDPERALGSLRTASLSSSFGANFINNTGEDITILSILYSVEQWRAGVTNRNDADKLDFQYSLDATGLGDGTWIDVDQLDSYSPNISTNSGALDGNLPENKSTISYTITGLSIPDGSEFWIRWTDSDITSSDDGLAIDDFQLDISEAAVLFSADPSSLNFGDVTIGNQETLQVTVENLGTTDDLEITNINSTNPVFTFLPNSFPVVIEPSDSQVFDITFTPVSAGSESGSIEFTHNATGSPSSITVTGNGESQAQAGILKFKTEERNLIDGTTSNPDTVVLSGYSGQPLKALQFNLLVGKTNGKLILKSVSRGDAIPAEQFNFSYEIFEGTTLPDGSKVDTVKVVILGNGSNAIQPDPEDQDILIFSYGILQIPDESDQTFNGLSNVTGATSAPVNDANISAGPDETINIHNGTLMGLLGDINFDNSVNILDILMMIDYMLGRIEFTQDQFDKADIAPWEDGNPLPSPDGVINVLDLAVLQNVVLTGTYPGGSTINKPSYIPTDFAGGASNKLSPGMNAKVTFYLTSDGITVALESIKKVKGLQIELDQLNAVIPQNTEIHSVFDQTFYHQENGLLRIISYDGQSNSVDPGEFIVAALPLVISDPSLIEVKDIVVADENNNALSKVEMEINYNNPAVLLDYALYQNYPNPFNPSTIVRFSVPKDEFVVIKIYDMIGQEVKSIFSGEAKAGTYTLIWDGLDSNGNMVSSGSYVYRMTAGDFVQSKKMIFIK